MKNVILFFLLVSTLSADYVAWSDKIVKKCTKRFERNFGLHLMGSGGAMMDEIETLHIVYFSNQRINLEQARKLILNTSQILIHAMNQETRLQAHIKNYPFSPNHLKSFAIAFINEKGENMELPYVSLVCITKGKISYSFFKDKFLDDMKIRESYEEAMEKVR